MREQRKPYPPLLREMLQKRLHKPNRLNPLSLVQIDDYRGYPMGIVQLPAQCKSQPSK